LGLRDDDEPVLQLLEERREQPSRRLDLGRRALVEEQAGLDVCRRRRDVLVQDLFRRRTVAEDLLDRESRPFDIRLADQHFEIHGDPPQQFLVARHAWTPEHRLSPLWSRKAS
jgi:hypothetical protein